MRMDSGLTPKDLQPALDRFFKLAAPKVQYLNTQWDTAQGAPVFTVRGQYTTRGWTEWTQGFQYGCALLLFDATGDTALWKLGRENTLLHMAPHISHIGVHDHGFNNVSTYGNLRRLALEGKASESQDALDMYAIALKASGAIQAARWTRIHDGSGFIHSFNGPHSLFSDTVRSVRSLIVGYMFGHVLMGEGDRRISLFGRAIEHMRNTARYNVYYGDGRDSYDVPGRVVHESIFNVHDGAYRCPSTQQGYSPFTTWTRGLSWIVLGFAEELECFAELPDDLLDPYGGREALEEMMIRPARAAADFFIEHTTADGIPFWDAGAPGLAYLGDYTEQVSDPGNPYEPVDSSAAAITAQGLLRLGQYLGIEGEGSRYYQAGLTAARTLFGAPYLSEDPAHQGLLLHSIYHRPNGWDHIPDGSKVPQGESSMWGDYHALELAVYLQRLAVNQEPLAFYRCALPRD